MRDNAQQLVLPAVVAAGALLALALSVPATAQPWRGSAAFQIEVEDRGGRPAAGVEAHLSLVETEPKVGPPPVISDATGTLSIQGLAEGQWLLELYYEGTRPWAALLRVEAGKRPVLVAGPVRDAAAPPLNVKLSKSNARPPSMAESRERSRAEERRSRRGERRRAAGREPASATAGQPGVSTPPVSPIPAPPPSQPAEEAPAPETAAQRAPEAEVHDPGQEPPAAPAPEALVTDPRGEPEPAPETPAPTVEPDPETPQPAVPAPETSESAVETPQPAVPEMPEPPAPQPAKPTATGPEAAGTATPEPTGELPEPAEVPAAAAEEVPESVSVRTREAGDCPECKRGESAVTAVQSAAPRAGGAEDCASHHSRVESAMERLLLTAAPTLAGYTGPLIDPGTGFLTAAAGLRVRDEVQPSLAPYLAPESPCQLLAVVLPATARYSGYAYGASDTSGAGACVGDEECDIGLARWTSHPVIVRGEGYTVLWGLFANRSPNRERRAALTAYFGVR